MKTYTFYNAKLGTCKHLTEEQMQEVKKFYGIDFPMWDEYYQRHDENSLRNARGDMFLWITDEPRELSEFEKPCYEFEFSTVYSPTIMKVRGRPRFFERPPQSWCYIEPRQTAD